MPDVWLAVLNRFVEKYLNVKGGPTVVDFSHQVQLQLPVLIGVEERYHQGWSRFAGTFGITGGAGQNAGAELHNPLGSNTIAVIERLSFSSNAAALVQFSVTFQAGPAGIADLTTAQTPTNLDGRSTAGSSMVFSTSTNTVGFARTLFRGAQVNGIETQMIVTHDQEITLIPGSAALILDLTVADIGFFHFMWRERPLESSELT